MDVLSETSLPPREEFANRLTGSECSPSDFTHAQSLWNIFNLRDFKEYLELYLMSDVCLLADVFDDYRETCISAYKLDPAYFLSAPQISMNAVLRFIKHAIECICDGEMYRMI